VAGILALIGALAAGDFLLLNNPRLAALILMALLALLSIVALILRLQQREIISVIFALFNVTAHIGMLIALLRTPDQRVLPIIFGVFIVLGELAKQRFLSISGYTEAGQSPAAMQNFSRVLTVLYTLLVVFMLI
jgi:hypothetical protein